MLQKHTYPKSRHIPPGILMHFHQIMEMVRCVLQLPGEFAISLSHFTFQIRSGHKYSILTFVFNIIKLGTFFFFSLALPLRNIDFERNPVPDNKYHPGVAHKRVVVPLRFFPQNLLDIELLCIDSQCLMTQHRFGGYGMRVKMKTGYGMTGL